MDAVEFVSGLPCKARPDTDDKERVVQALRTFYCKFLSEDGIEGTSFDLQVLDALDLILLCPELWELKRGLLQRNGNRTHSGGLCGSVSETPGGTTNLDHCRYVLHLHSSDRQTGEKA